MKKSELIDQINFLFPEDDLDIKVTIRGEKTYTMFDNISVGAGYINAETTKVTPYISLYLKESDSMVAKIV